jgi:hypothetical protein
MNRALRLALVAFASAGGAMASRSEEAAKPAPIPTEKPTRAVSPRMAEVLRATLPSYDDFIRQQPPPPSEPAKPVVPLETDLSVTSLPRYVVKELRLPTSTEVMSRRAVEEAAMNRYLGPKDGLDRGVLNAFTIKQLWEKIPVIGKILPPPIPSISNEQRAMQRYYEDLRLEKKNDLLELSALTALSGDAAQAERIKRETQRAFKNE